MNRRLFVLVVSLILAGAGNSARAQVQVQPPEFIVIEGQIIWISAQRMIVAPANDVSVNVDLSRIYQGDLRKISLGNFVIVTGQFLRPTRTLLASSIQVISAWYPQAPQSP